MARILKGTDVAGSIGSKTAARVKVLKENGITPVLAIVRAGEEEDQSVYAASAARRCNAAGIEARTIKLPHDASREMVLSSIDELNRDNSVHGVLVLRPLPGHIDEPEVLNGLLACKDIDGITSTSLAGVVAGNNAGFATGIGFAPCTAQAIMEILSYYGIDCTGKHAVVIGRSLVVGKPAALMLTDANATVTVCHTKTKDIQSITNNADIIVAATGRPGSLTGGYFSPGQTVIDVGIAWDEEKGKLCGDVMFDEAEQIVAAITPVPGGVGAVTSAVLASHVAEAAEKRR